MSDEQQRYEVRLDDETRAVAEALWGEGYAAEIEAQLTAYLAAGMVELAGEKPEVKAVPVACPITDILSTSTLCCGNVTECERPESAQSGENVAAQGETHPPCESPEAAESHPPRRAPHPTHPATPGDPA